MSDNPNPNNPESVPGAASAAGAPAEGSPPQAERVDHAERLRWTAFYARSVPQIERRELGTLSLRLEAAAAEIDRLQASLETTSKELERLRNP